MTGLRAALRGAVRAGPLLCAVACGSGAAAPGAAGGGLDAASPTKPGLDGGAAVPRCAGPGYAGTPEHVEFRHLSATVVDANGKPVPHLIAQACGTNLCLNGTTDGSGHVVIDANASETKPAFKYGDGVNYARFALPLAGPTVSVDLGSQATFAFDPPALGVPLTPSAEATSRGFTLTLPADLEPIQPDPFDFPTADLQKFRAVEVPVAAAPAAVDGSLGFGLLVALTPSDTALCPPAKLTVPNSPGWPAGSLVEFFLHGIDVEEQWAPYGGWAKVSAGTVSADGASIATDPDGGLPQLSIVGVRRIQ
jgi:hypothetical protein